MGQGGGALRRRQMVDIEFDGSSKSCSSHVWPSADDDQTSRIWDLSTGETKTELRGHENVVECSVFAPTNTYSAIRELAGLGVSAAFHRLLRYAEMVAACTG